MTPQELRDALIRYGYPAAQTFVPSAPISSINVPLAAMSFVHAPRSAIPSNDVPMSDALPINEANEVN